MDSTVPKLQYYKLRDGASAPEFATEGSACFDLRVCWETEEEMWGPIKGRTIKKGKKLLVPTGLAFNIPEGYSIRWHPKSGLACKHGITLTNCEGIIDSDYHHEVFVCVWNTSDENDYYLRQGDKICQAELVRNEHYHIEETLEQPQKTTTRDGGFGSTGK